MHELPGTERQEKINSIRRRVGIEEGQVALLSKRDEERQLNWQSGLLYMEKRQALLSQNLPEDEFKSALDELRKEYFKQEAPVIAKEEDELNFFRFQRERVFGWN